MAVTHEPEPLAALGRIRRATDLPAVFGGAAPQRPGTGVGGEPVMGYLRNVMRKLGTPPRFPAVGSPP